MRDEQNTLLLTQNILNTAEQQASLCNLEAMIDYVGIKTILESLSHICWDKAEHIRTNYDDKPLARTWTKDGDIISRLKSKLTN